MQKRSTSLALTLVWLICPFSVPPTVKAQCCQKPPEASHSPANISATRSAEAAGTSLLHDQPKVRIEWIINAANRFADHVSRWLNLSLADYSTQWSSWCAGFNRGPSQPCSTKCCTKPGQNQSPPVQGSRCCYQPCPTQNAPSAKSKGS